MSEYKDRYDEEINYLNEIIDLLNYKLQADREKLENKKVDLVESRKEMWENTTHSSADMDKLADLNQYLSALNAQTMSYGETAKAVQKYEKMLDNPYFARIDFTEEGYDDTEKIYIGLFNLMNDETHEIKVYDWRAPISSLYYRNEIGPVEYTAPAGKIKGYISLKRQYKIRKGKMEYFFDSNINIVDDMLKEALSKNMSSKMQTIVETIQKQQDLIIRDLNSELLIVQGVAGSGKTSVALHRIAFLLYQGLSLKLKSNNIVIISPNALFSKYISNVLPSLGEEDIEEITLENIFVRYFNNRLSIKSKSEQFEDIICAKTENRKNFLRSVIEFKGSYEMAEIINRFIYYFEHKMIEFDDAYYNGKYLESRQLLKQLFLSNKLNMPPYKKLKIIESRLMDKVNDLRHVRREKIQENVKNTKNHQFEIKSFTRYVAQRETSAFKKKIQRFTEFDSYDLYKKLFKNKNLFYKLSKGLKLPQNIDKIIDYTNNSINDPYNIPYADGLCMMYLKIKAEGFDLYSEIKQVFVDEAQDYYPLHYMILNTIFKDSRFTVVGDVNQSIEKQRDLSIYDEIETILNKRKSNKLFLNKSYRCSYEINKFSQKLLDTGRDTEFFERNEGEPEIINKNTLEELHEKMIEDIKKYQSEGFDSVSIITKSRKQASELYFKINDKIDATLIDYVERGNENITGITIVPIYMAKGLEFDAVMVYDVSEENYNTNYDKGLLYIACTRAMHKLSLYHTNELTHFLK